MINRDRAQRALKAGPTHPDYDKAMKHAHAHYKGLLRALEREQAMRRDWGAE